VAIALGLGKMIGWKRIVVTVGERIGKSHLTYAQGVSGELVAMATIGDADAFGPPVSTTHMLSSGVAGTMAADRSGLQWSPVRNLVMAWPRSCLRARCSGRSAIRSRSSGPRPLAGSGSAALAFARCGAEQ
jgi:phosphate/sulfate permease